MTSSWFFLSTVNYDSRSTTHQRYNNVNWNGFHPWRSQVMTCAGKFWSIYLLNVRMGRRILYYFNYPHRLEISEIFIHPPSKYICSNNFKFKTYGIKLVFPSHFTSVLRLRLSVYSGDTKTWRVSHCSKRQLFSPIIRKIKP